MIVSASIRFARYKGEDLDVFCLISYNVVKGQCGWFGAAASETSVLASTPKCLQATEATAVTRVAT